MAGHDPLYSLPQEISLNIFSRLPAQSVLYCKQVCRSWRKILPYCHRANTNYFAHQHVKQQQGHDIHALVQQKQHRPVDRYHYGSDSGTMMSFVAFDSHAQALGYLEYHGKRDNYRLIKIKFPADICGVVGSDNGLICLTVKTKYKGIPTLDYRTLDDPDEPLYTCNPITKECVTLPGKSINNTKCVGGVSIAHGFCYHPLYTLGSGRGWRSAGELNCFLRPKYLRGPPGVCVNGALYWICQESGSIVGFDLGDEKFHFLPVPVEMLYRTRRIFVMRRCLCYEYSDGSSLEVWLLRKNKEEDSSSHHMNEQYYKSWIWNKEFKIPLEDAYSRITYSFENGYTKR
ncbi:F-box protein At1g53790-like [Papaver somniferum]|uniref:F-box protein At1g53790-like n=1 Tax=Papaver somniferum TaxID=3469 RepID=UPI000E6FC1F8|nr:F-box protein At1g53790-like [Papaver somniferum]